MNKLFTHPLIDALGWTLLHSLWVFVLIALVYRLILTIPLARRAHFRYALSLFTLSCMLVCIFLLFFQHLGTPPPSSKELAQPFSQRLHSSEGPNLEINQVPQPPNTYIPTRTSSYAFPDGIQGYLLALIPSLTGIWILGVIFMLFRFTGSYWYIRKLKFRKTQPVKESWQSTVKKLKRTLGIRRQVRVLASPYIGEPLTIGHFKPVILVPLSLMTQQPPEFIEAILLHELAHIRRYDFLVNLIQTWVEILLFYHPAVWYISQEVRISREHCCDDMVVKINQDPLIYAQALTQISLLKREITPKLSLSMMGKKGRLSERVFRIMGNPPSHSSILHTFLLFVLFIAIGLGIAFNPHKLYQHYFQAEDRGDILIFTISPQSDVDDFNRWQREVKAHSGKEILISRTLEKGTNNESYTLSVKDANTHTPISTHRVEGDTFERTLIYDKRNYTLYITTRDTWYVSFYNLYLEKGGRCPSFDLEGNNYSELRNTLANLFPGTDLACINRQPRHVSSLDSTIFEIRITPNTHLDEFLNWRFICQYLGVKMDFTHLDWDEVKQEWVRASGWYQTVEGEIKTFGFHNFSRISLFVDGTHKGIINNEVKFRTEEEPQLEEKRIAYFLDDKYVEKSVIDTFSSSLIDLIIVQSAADIYVQNLVPGLEADEARMFYSKRLPLIVPETEVVWIAPNHVIQKLDHEVFRHGPTRYSVPYSRKDYEAEYQELAEGVKKVNIGKTRDNRRVGIHQYLPPVSGFGQGYKLDKHEALKQYGVSGEHGVYVEKTKPYTNDERKVSEPSHTELIPLTFSIRALELGRGSKDPERLSNLDLATVNIDLNSTLVINGQRISSEPTTKKQSYASLRPEDIKRIRFLDQKEAGAIYKTEGAVEIEANGTWNPLYGNNIPRFIEKVEWRDSIVFFYLNYSIEAQMSVVASEDSLSFSYKGENAKFPLKPFQGTFYLVNKEEARIRFKREVATELGVMDYRISSLATDRKWN
ncbi:MAG: M56 family metallopeptidase [Bacteroidota bacterium]